MNCRYEECEYNAISGCMCYDVERVRRILDTPEGKAQLEAIVKSSREFMKKLKRDSRVTPEMMQQPMTI